MAAESDEQIDVRLRWQLDSPRARVWNTSLTVHDPRAETAVISQIENRSQSGRTTGAIELSEDGRTLKFQTRHAINGGAIQFRLRASPEATIAIESSGVPGNVKQPRIPSQQIPIVDLIGEESVSAASESPVTAPRSSESTESSKQPAWSLSRVRGDALRFDGIDPLPMVAPGSPLQFSVHANSLAQHASRRLTLQYSLFDLNDGQTIAEHRIPLTVDSRGNSDAIAIDETAPDRPGVYELRCLLVQDDENIWTRFRRSQPILQITRPLVVIAQHDDADAAAEGAEQDRDQPPGWSVIGAIRPSEDSWAVGQWLPKQTTRFIPGNGLQARADVSDIQLLSETYRGESISLIQPQATFKATLPVMASGIPHRVTLRFPQDRTTRFRIEILPADDGGAAVRSYELHVEPADSDGEGWRSQSFVHYPSESDQIWITNLDPSEPAAFESISVRAGPQRLSAAETASSHAGHRSAVVRLQDNQWIDVLSTDIADQDLVGQCSADTIAMQRLWIAAGRLADQALALGFNGLMIPANAGGRLWFESTALHGLVSDELDNHQLELILKLLEDSGLDVYVSLRPNMLLSQPESAIRQQPDLLHQLTRELDSNRKAYNPLHDSVQNGLRELIGDLDQHCSPSACFAGIAIAIDKDCHLSDMSEPFHDLGTLTLFARAKGSTADLREVRAWVTEHGTARFQAWIDAQMQTAVSRLFQTLSDRKHLLIAAAESSNPADDQKQTSMPRVIAPKSDATQVDEWSPPLRAVSYRYRSDRVLSKHLLLQQQLLGATAEMRGQAVAVVGDDDAGSDLVMSAELTDDVTELIQRLDPSMMILALPSASMTLHDNLGPLIRSYVSMPPAVMQIVEPSDPASRTMQLTTRTKDGFRYVTMISQVPWTSEVDLESAGPAEWIRIEGAQNLSDPGPISQVGAKRSRITVKPGELVVLRSKTANDRAEIKWWSSRVSGGSNALEEIKRKVTLIVERIGILAEFEQYDVLKNGGFEQAGGMGLVGWLHAQHPPGCVRVDDSECVEGEHSVLLTTTASTASRTWIVTETIDPPASGRLAVSLACRGERIPDDSKHQLRVSIEATRRGKPIRFSSQFDVPRNGQWGPREVVLEADGIDRSTVNTLRLTIDSLSPGRVWIDDVRLHDQFPLASEREEIKSLAFLAVQGLRRGDLIAAGRLLQNPWARRLLALPGRAAATPVNESVDRQEETPGVAERIRSWLPRPLRF